MCAKYGYLKLTGNCEKKKTKKPNGSVNKDCWTGEKNYNYFKTQTSDRRTRGGTRKKLHAIKRVIGCYVVFKVGNSLGVLKALNFQPRLLFTHPLPTDISTQVHCFVFRIKRFCILIGSFGFHGLSRNPRVDFGSPYFHYLSELWWREASKTITQRNHNENVETISGKINFSVEIQNFFVVFGVMVETLHLHENVITNQRISRFSPERFRKIFDFWCITRKSIRIKKKKRFN